MRYMDREYQALKTIPFKAKTYKTISGIWRLCA
jgi:hypothetical protein